MAERGTTRSLTVHPSIHLFHTFSLALVLCRVMRLEPFLGHRQENPPDRWPVHRDDKHTYSYSHLLTVSSSPVLYVSGLWEKPTSTQREQTNSTQKDSCSSWDSNTVHTAPHYTRLIMFLFFSTVYIYFMWFNFLLCFYYVFGM